MNRREVLIATAGAATLTLLPSGAARARAAIAVYDGRSPESAAFAQQARSIGVRLVDVAHEDVALWRGVRDGLGLVPGAQLIGMTGWSDWVLLRGFLGERGLRVRHEMRVDCCAAHPAGSALARLTEAAGRRSRTMLHAERDTTLFAWKMG